MMKQITTLFLSLMLIVTASCQEARTVKVTVTEEDGTLIKDAQVSAWYMGYRPGESKEDKGYTDVLGVFIAHGTPLLRIEATITKEGYYNSSSGRLSRKQDHDVTFVLRKVKNPIALYARKFRGRVPVSGEVCGFDFEKGDWVVPHGKGKKADILISGTKEVKSRNDRKAVVEITFPNEQDGIQEDSDWIKASVFKTTRLLNNNSSNIFLHWGSIIDICTDIFRYSKQNFT